MKAGRLIFGVVAILLSASGTGALETDQFYAWNRPLKDATDAINAEVNSEIVDVLKHVNARRRPSSCEQVEGAIYDRFEYAVISRLELWAMNTSLLERIPASPDDAPAYKREWLYGATSPLDSINWMPPSPTIEIAGVRIGADKLGHFFADGEWAVRLYRHSSKHGATDDEAMARALRVSLNIERTIWGEGTSGVLSLSDLAADYQGLMFYRGLCGGPEPMLTLTSGGWRLRKPFDFRDWVGPDWDESWRPCIYTRSRWAKVAPVMRRYCDLLQDPEVQARRAAYAARDRESPLSTFIQGLVAAGKLDDPAQFTIEAVCNAPPRP